MTSVAMSRRFVRDYQSALAGTQDSLERRIRTLTRSFQANPAESAGGKPVAGLPHGALEFKWTSSHRIIALQDGDRLAYLAFGDHDLIDSRRKRYSTEEFARDVLALVPVPAVFSPEPARGASLFTDQRTRSRSVFPGETDPDWISRLDRAQEDAVLRALDIASARRPDDPPAVMFVVGGPGTGKTSVLLNVMKFAYEVQGLRPGLSVTDELAKYAERSIGVSLSGLRTSRTTRGRGFDVVLVDDPFGPMVIDEYVRHWEVVDNRRPRLLLFAFDPLQFGQDVTDSAFNELVREMRADVVWLESCYRQKELVGRESRRVANVVAAITPYRASGSVEDWERTHREITQKANDVTFVNPGGYTAVYEDATIADAQSEIARITGGPLWSHWQPLLVVVDESGEPPAAILQTLRAVRCRVLSFSDLGDIKGLEFQHVFLLLRRTTYDEIRTPSGGQGRNTYAKQRLVRIPFSRAKDSLVTFVFDAEAREVERPGDNRRDFHKVRAEVHRRRGEHRKLGDMLMAARANVDGTTKASESPGTEVASILDGLIETHSQILRELSMLEATARSIEGAPLAADQERLREEFVDRQRENQSTYDRWARELTAALESIPILLGSTTEHDAQTPDPAGP